MAQLERCFCCASRAFDSKLNYIVTGTPINHIANATVESFEFIPDDDPQLVDLLSQIGALPETGLVVRVQQTDGRATQFGFMAQITLF